MSHESGLMRLLEKGGSPYGTRSHPALFSPGTQSDFI